MPRLSTETYGTGDQRWIGSTHGIYNCQTYAPSTDEFTVAAYPDGYVPSGTPVALVADLLVPFDGAAVDGSEVLHGFLYTDQAVPPSGGWPVLRHNVDIKTSLLPVAFDPTGVTTTGSFTYTETGA